MLKNGLQPSLEGRGQVVAAGDERECEGAKNQINPTPAWPSVGTHHGLDDSDNCDSGDEKGRQWSKWPYQRHMSDRLNYKSHSFQLSINLLILNQKI